MHSFVPEILAAQIENGNLTESSPAGYLIVPAPRRAARGRSGELFFAALDLHSRTALPAAEIDRLAALMSKVYFETPGSVTAALRAAFTAANAEVLPFSQGPSSASLPGAGILQLNAVCAVLRESDLLFGYAGDVLALIVRESGVEQYPASGDSPARSLGVALNIDLRYGHTVVSAETTLLLTASPTPAWSASAPAGLARLSLRAIGERMAQQSSARPGSFGAMLVRLTQATAVTKSASLLERIRPQGATREKPVLMRGKITVPDQRAVKPTPLAEEGASATASQPAPVDRSLRQPPSAIAPRRFPPQETWSEGTGPVPIQSVGSRAENISQEGRVPWHSAAAPIPIRGSSTPRPTAREAMAAFAHSARNTVEAAGAGIRRFLAGILPRGVLQKNDLFTLSPALMLGTAIAIPLVVVAVAGVIYFRKGRELEFDRLMQEARVEAAAASAQTDPLPAREAWQRTYDLLKTAAGYGSSEEFTTLMNQTARTLDTFDGIEPLDFHPAVAGGLEAGTRITALLAGDRELYALDSGHTKVIRLLLGQGGYQLDDTFDCQAGTYPEIAVGPPLDIAWVPDLAVGDQNPTSSRGGAVVALDAKGVMLYCPPGGRAMAGTLPTPRTNWSTPAAIDYYSGKLYVLDPGANGFWRYTMGEDNSFDKAPSDYFSTEHPLISDVVDFAVVRGEVFFLHADGHVTRCQFDPLLQANKGESTGGALCREWPFNDTRPGRSANSRIQDAMLSRLFYNDYPEPTLFFLDPIGRGAYRFSLALDFISRYRVTIAPEQEEATALTVGSDKMLYIAIGNQIYFAQTRTP